MNTLARTSEDITDTYRSFGFAGPVYRVLARVDERTVRVCVVETGEELNYPVVQALDDPEAE